MARKSQLKFDTTVRSSCDIVRRLSVTSFASTQCVFGDSMYSFFPMLARLLTIFAPTAEGGGLPAERSLAARFSDDRISDPANIAAERRLSVNEGETAPFRFHPMHFCAE